MDGQAENKNVVGTIKEIKQYCLRNKVDGIFYTLPDNSTLIENLADFVVKNYMDFNLIQDAEGLSGC